MTATLNDQQKACDDAKNQVTLDRRDLWDYVRSAIHAALTDKIPKDCVTSWAWEEATNRTFDIFRKIVDTASLPRASDAPAKGQLGWKLAMRVMQSDLFDKLDDAERAECDALVRANPYMGKITAAAPATAAHAGAIPDLTAIWETLEDEDEGDEEIHPTPESERAAFNAMMRWHLIRLLQAWRYGGDLRAVGMAAFEWARTNDVGQEAFKASERAVKLAAPTAAVDAAPAALTAPDFSNALTPYGMLVRALRIVAGTTLYSMAQYLSRTPADLSAIEFGRKPLTDEMIAKTAAYFSSTGILGTDAALCVAAQQSSNSADAGEGS